MGKTTVYALLICLIIMAVFFIIVESVGGTAVKEAEPSLPGENITEFSLVSFWN